MLDSETKRRLDTARDTLVGKVPDPKSQVEQITIALIYKFMDDMDKSSVEMGGKAGFFVEEYEKYAWPKLFDARIGGYDMLALYGDAMARLGQNPHLPQLFRDIFKNAYLPYRDPETLRLFLKTINEFSYDNSERLGDAFEYLLSILGSQGDAGQFRTPRHIIDFMVAAVAPQKNEVIFDPACGTAGFLISAYKYIVAENTAKSAGDLLTAAERKALLENFKGYDISPDMVRLSLVNLYLHGFVQPHIFEYDTLTSTDRWSDYADVILANPPFMSPKGGIKPHDRFGVQSNRSEVLFVDYIAEHLNAAGRAAVIVPEGIIFQSAGAYKTLRKLLVEKYLYAVVSLPAGVFNPYSGVKTSILFLDRAIAKRNESVLFLKVENDGFGLGAQRKANDKNDLPAALGALREFQRGITTNLTNDTNGRALVVAKAEIAKGGEYNLTGERYRVTEKRGARKWEMVRLGDTDLFSVESGGTPDSQNKDFWDGDIAWATLVDLPAKDYISEIRDTQRKITTQGFDNSSAKIVPAKSVIVSSRATIGRIGITKIPLCTNQGFKNIIIKNFEKVDPVFLAYMLKPLVPKMDALASGGTFKEISKTSFCTLEIPLPPLEVQREIVAEITEYQRVIDGARQVVDNWKPRIEADEGWERAKLGDVCEIKAGGTPSTAEKMYYEGGSIPWLKSEVCRDEVIHKAFTFITEQGFKNSSAKMLNANSTLIALVGATIGKTAFITFEAATNQNVAGLYPLDANKLNELFLFYSVQGLYEKFIKMSDRNFKMANLSFVKTLEIPLPLLDVQQKIVEKIENERHIIDGNRELTQIYDSKIKSVINKVWG